MTSSEDSKSASGFWRAVLIAGMAFMLGGIFTHHFTKKPAKCPPAISCAPVVPCAPVVSRAPDTGEVSALMAEAEAVLAKVRASEFHMGQRVTLPEGVDAFLSRDKKCSMDKGGELTILEDSGEADTMKGRYRPAPAGHRKTAVSDPSSDTGLDECPAGMVAFSNGDLQSVFLDKQETTAWDVREKDKLRRIFPR